MPAACQVEPMSPGDGPQVARLWAQFMREHEAYWPYVQVRGTRLTPLAEHYESLGAAGQAWVARGPRGRLVGFAAVVLDRPRVATRYVQATLSDLYVLPTHRGRGLGKGLAQAAIAHGQALGLHALKLTVMQGNEAARHLYKTLGFWPQSEVLVLPLDPELAGPGPAHPWAATWAAQGGPFPAPPNAEPAWEAPRP